MPVLGRTGSVPLKQWVVRFASKSRAGEVVHIREAEYPVRRGFSILSLMSRNTGSPAFAGDDKTPDSIFKQPSQAVIASGAKQSILPHKERMDCFVASLLAMTALQFPHRPPHSRGAMRP